MNKRFGLGGGMSPVTSCSLLAILSPLALVQIVTALHLISTLLIDDLARSRIYDRSKTNRSFVCVGQQWFSVRLQIINLSPIVGVSGAVRFAGALAASCAHECLQLEWSKPQTSFPARCSGLTCSSPLQASIGSKQNAHDYACSALKSSPSDIRDVFICHLHRITVNEIKYHRIYLYVDIKGEWSDSVLWGFWKKGWTKVGLDQSSNWVVGYWALEV